MGKAVKSIEFCYTSCSPTDSSLLWLVLVFLGIHSFQNRQVWGRIALCRRLRYGFSSAKRPDTGLIPFCCSFPSKKKEIVCFSCFCSFVYLLVLGGFVSPYRIMCLGFNIWETHSYLPACGGVGYMTHKKPLKSQFWCSMTALHLTAFTARDFKPHGKWPQNLPCFLCGFCKAHGKHLIWGKKETCLWSSWGWWTLWALGSAETWVASTQIHFVTCMGKRPAHHSLCSHNLQFCCRWRPKFGVFFHLEFLISF